MAILNPGPDTVEDIQETRVALAFSGGVALAVYESGVAIEFFRLVNREGVYKEFTSQIGKVVVDVITGSSAGGLNGAFLANALVNGGDLTKVLDLWQKDADIDKLMYGPLKANPESLLDGGWFHQRILDALTGDPRPGYNGAALQSAIDLYITATNVPGEPVEVETLDKARIATRTHRQVFRFRYREAQPGSDDEPVNDFKSKEDMQRLALAGRATASFPFAFAPVLIAKDLMSRHALHLTEDAYHIDGGVLDNRPIDLALQAIATRRADKRVQRTLFFIEPDPESILANATGTAPRAYSAPEVVVKALVELPSYQSLTGTLQGIQKHNESIAERKRTLAYFNEASVLFRRPPGNCTSGTSGEGQARAIEQDDGDGQPRRCGKTKFIPPDDRSSAFFRAMEDGYMDLRLERGVSESTELFRSLKKLGTELRGQLELEALGGARAAEMNGTVLEEEDCPLHAILYRTKIVILDYLDLKYWRRLYRYLVQVVRDLYPTARPAGTGDGRSDAPPAERRRAIETLNRLKDHFYNCEAKVRELEAAQAADQKAEVAQVLVHVQTALTLVGVQNGAIQSALGQHEKQLGPATLSADQRSELERELRLQRMRLFVQPVEDLLKRVQQSSLLHGRRQFLNGLYQNSRRTLKNEVLELLRARSARAAVPERDAERDGECPRDFAAAPADGYWSLVDALDSFFLRDMMVYPLMQGDEIAAELEPIHFVRISPVDAAGDGTPGKLAGKSLAHFGGFLSEAWRGNDIVRGRLDAAEIILRTFLPAKEQEPMRLMLLDQAAHEIREAMQVRKMKILRPAKQTLARLPAADKVRWGLGGIMTTVKVLRKSVADSGSAGWLQWLINPLNYTVNVLSWVVLVVAVACKWLGSRKTLRHVAAGLLIGIISIVLWQTRDTWLAWLLRLLHAVVP